MEEYTRRKFIILFLVLLAPMLLGQTGNQSPKTNRGSFGDVRANIMESLLATAFPGSPFRWSPDLQIEHSAGIFSDVQFPGFTFSIAPDGSIYGASGIELAHAKEQAIFLSKQLRQPNHKHFASTIAVFRATIQGQVTRARTFELDPEDPLAEVKLIHVTDWSKNPWPVLQIQYISHISTQDSHIQIEWGSTFDVNSDAFISRIPMGIVTKSKSGPGQIRMFSIQRLSSNAIQITDVLSKQTMQYSCADPCITDSQTLLAQWVH